MLSGKSVVRKCCRLAKVVLESKAIWQKRCQKVMPPGKSGVRKWCHLAKVVSSQLTEQREVQTKAPQCASFQSWCHSVTLHHCHALYITLQISTPVYFPDTHLCIFGYAPPSLSLFRNITRKGNCVKRLHLQCYIYCDWCPSVRPCNASCTLKACEDYGCAPSAAGPCPCWWRWSWTGDSGHGHNPGGSRKWHLASHKCTRRVCPTTEALCMCFQWMSAWICFFRTTEPFIYGINALKHNFKDSWNLPK